MTDNKILTDEQYSILLEGESYFEEYSKVNYCRTINPRFLTKMQQVYQEFYNSPLNINCNTCLGGALSKLWYHMGIKKGKIEEAEELLKAKEDDQKRTKANTRSK